MSTTTAARTPASAPLPINEALNRMHQPVSVEEDQNGVNDDACLGSFKVFTLLSSEERRDSFKYERGMTKSASSGTFHGSSDDLMGHAPATTSSKVCTYTIDWLVNIVVVCAYTWNFVMKMLGLRGFSHVSLKR